MHFSEKILALHQKWFHNICFCEGVSNNKTANSNMKENVLSMSVCVQIYNELSSHLKNEFPGLIFTVDQWPQPKVVACTLDKQSTQKVTVIYSEFLKDIDSILTRLYKIYTYLFTSLVSICNKNTNISLHYDEYQLHLVSKV